MSLAQLAEITGASASHVKHLLAAGRRQGLVEIDGFDIVPAGPGSAKRNLYRLAPDAPRAAPTLVVEDGAWVLRFAPDEAGR